MKGKIVLPKFYETRYTDDYKYLFGLIAEHYKWDIEYTNSPSLMGYDVAMIFATPHHMRPYTMNHLQDIHPDIKLIGFMKDIHHYDKPEVMNSMDIMMDRYDYIISPSYNMFNKLWDDYSYKMFYLPDFYCPSERFDLPYNESPLNRCLLSGAVTKSIYPLRNYILQHNENMKLDYLGSPVLWTSPNHISFNNQHNIIHDKYAEMINKYQCCVTDTSIFGYTLAKIFEIPATGSLLISDFNPDMERLGFQPGVHFVQIDDKIAIEQVNDCLEHPEEYKHVRHNGMNFVRSNHNVNKRFEQFQEIVCPLLEQH